MNEVETTRLATKAEKFYSMLLLLYPKNYRRRFGYEMEETFYQIYLDEFAENKEIGIGFWLHQLNDIVKSVIEQHVADMQKRGPKKYLKDTLHITSYSIIGFVLVLPFLLVFSIDMLVVLFTGSREAMQPLYHSVFWSMPILPIWLLGFPIVAIFLNLIPVFQSIQKAKFPLFSLRFIISNAAAFVIVAIGFGAVVLVFGHDVIPCTVSDLLKYGPLKIVQIFQVCRNT